MSKVNPPPLRVPRALSIDRETFNYFTQLHHFLLQMWTKIGGAADGGEVASGDALFELPVTVDIEPLQRLIQSMDALGQTSALAQRIEALETRIEAMDVAHRDPRIEELEILTYGSELQ